MKTDLKYVSSLDIVTVKYSDHDVTHEAPSSLDNNLMFLFDNTNRVVGVEITRASRLSRGKFEDHAVRDYIPTDILSALDRFYAKI